uniref:Selenoprotein T n=2 Tax=Coturnix japonica TaxID=93934 RepID=A0A8C2U7V7_COTJA
MRLGPGAGPGRGLVLLLLLLLLVAALCGQGSAQHGAMPAKKLRVAYGTGPLLKFQICVS